MPYLIGIDEAGYGPNLGPLVISASVWRVPDAPAKCDLYELLAAAVCGEVEAARNGKAARLAIADSKQLYSPGGGVGLLERGVLASLAVSQQPIADWMELWDLLRADPYEDRAAEPWLSEFTLPLPHAATPADLESGIRLLRSACETTGVELVALRSRAVLPARFNQLLRTAGNKAQALSQTSLGLLAELLAPLPPEPVLVICDKHGGRNHYQQLLQMVFPEYLVEVHAEGRAESRYCWGPPSARVEVRFCVGGESFLPAALASMTCKYLRELAMHAFNEFWCSRVPELLPTAGYPGDAKRFKSQISKLQKSLKIPDELLWREK